MYRFALGLWALGLAAGMGDGAGAQTNGVTAQARATRVHTVRHRHGAHRHVSRHVPHSHSKPPVDGGDRLAAAPVPNENIGPPAADHPNTPSPSVQPGELQMHFPPAGDGFLPASSHTEMDNLDTPKVPGVTVKVPVGTPPAPP